ncbi:MAG TPA: EAL domain-containing protein, partial [Gammaproteobacteria bacterium]
RSKSALNFEFVVVYERRIHYYEARMMMIKLNEVIVLVRDITERKQAEEQIAYLAYHDSLTGLPNNRLFKDRLNQGIAYAKRNNTQLAVLFLDLDRFKLINDTMGHGVGDQLLQATADRLIEGIRKTDSIGFSASALGSSVARLGGDEFTILLEDIEDTKTVTRVAERLIQIVARSIQLGDQEVYTSTSIGIAIYPEDGINSELLLKNADAAMYHAKAQGRNNFQYYNASMNEASVQQLILENNLRKALENNELCLHYQPQVSVATGQLVGMEALIRWKHSEKGFISPSVFIPVAEETGLIMEIGEWVIKQACQQGAEWAQKGYKQVPISVNLSAKQLREEKLTEMIAQVLVDTGMSAKYLGIELTESAIIIEPEMALSRLQSIKSLGIKLSLDDFGTGYSSLSYLKRFPIDTLKIDQAFIRDIKVDHEDAALVKAIIAMAHGLGMDVVAEGVEQQEQLEFLGANACDTIQGYLFSRALPAEEIENYFQKF